MNWSFLRKPNLSQKKFLWAFIGIAVALAAYFFLLVPLVEARKKADQEMTRNQRILLKYEEVLRNRKAVEEGLARTQKLREEIQKRLIPGETPQLGAANLQDLVKRLAEKNDLGLRSFRNLDSKEVGSFRRISVQIEFNPLSSVQNLTQFLYELEHQEQKLMISEMNLLVFNPRMPNNIQGNLIISGFMKGTKGKERGRER